MNKDMISYYEDRALEYDKVYSNPAEQDDLHEATRIFQTLFSQKTVLEIACGTGYWTEQIAKTATSIHATDINKSMLEIAQQKQIKNTSFAIADMYSLSNGTKYEGVFGGFIWSHILLQDLDKFIYGIKNCLAPDGAIAFIDSNYVSGSNHDIKKITQTDNHGNTYQTRQLENGTSHLVLKNFPTQDLLFQKLSTIATKIEFIPLKFYWIVTCQLKNNVNHINI